MTRKSNFYSFIDLIAYTHKLLAYLDLYRICEHSSPSRFSASLILEQAALVL